MVFVDFYMENTAIDKKRRAMYNVKKGSEAMQKTIYDGNALDKYNYNTYKFLSVASAGVHVNVQHITERKKGRTDYHLLYVERGEVICWVNEREYRLSSGGYVLYSPGDMQWYEQNGGICYWAHFSGKAAEEILIDAGLKRKPVSPGERAHPEIISAFERLVYIYLTEGQKNSLALCAALLTVLSSFKLCRGVECGATTDRLFPVITYMHKHYFEEIDIDRYAEILALSPGRFAHVFKEQTGTSPYAYVLDIRLERSLELLALSDFSVFEVAGRVGFTDPLYFSKLFKKRYGTSPLKYRRQKWQNATRRTKSTGCD